MRNKPSCVLFLFLAAIIWGFAFVAQVFGGEHLGTFYFNGIRFLIGGVVLIPVIMIFENGKNSANKISVLSGIVAGIILFTATNLQQQGITITGSSGKAGFLTAIYTVLVPIFSMIFLKKRTNRNSWLGAVLALVGLFFILSGDMSSKDRAFMEIDVRLSMGKGFHTGISMGYGDLILLACAVAFTVHIIYIDYFNKSIRPIHFSCTQFLTAGLLSLVFALFTETITPTAVQNALIPLLYSGIMSTGVAYTLQIIGQKGVHPTVSAIIMSTESMFAAIGGAMLLKERMSIPAYIGCGIILFGVIIAQIPVNSSKHG